MKQSRKEQKDKELRDRIVKVLHKYKIKNQTDFIEKYNEMFSEDNTVKPYNDQSQISKLFDKFDIKRNENGIYREPKTPKKIPIENRVMEMASKYYIQETISPTTDIAAYIIKTTQGKEEFVCEAILNKMQFKNTALIPAYGSVVLLGDDNEIDNFVIMLSDFRRKQKKKKSTQSNT